MGEGKGVVKTQTVSPPGQPPLTPVPVMKLQGVDLVVGVPGGTWVISGSAP